MSRFVKACPDVKIAAGQSISNVVISHNVYDDSFAISLFAPSALDAAHVYTIEVSPNPDDPSPLWVTLFDGTANVAPPAAGLAQVYISPVWRAFRIHDTTGTAAADRIWKMNAEEFITK